MNTEIQKVQNPMGVATPDHGVIGQESSAHAMAEVQAQVIMAKNYPRDTIQAVDNIINECTRQSLAESSTYAYPRGGKKITGPSIRLAEAIARHWGNLDFGIKELDQRNGESSVIAYCWDLQTNVRETKTFKVKHIRSTKAGNKILTDSRDIYELVANQGARRLRSCILGVIPGDVVDAAEKQCAITMNATADLSKEGIQKLVTAFEDKGITKEHIESFIGCHIAAINAAQVVNLRNIFSSLKDGMSNPWDWFNIEKPKSKETKKVESDIL